MKCTEISNKIPLTVMVLLVCGFLLLLQFILFMKCITISCLGIGIKLHHAKMEKNKE